MLVDSNSSLPTSVKKSLPTNDGQDIFRLVLNSALVNGDAEPVAYAKAWNSIAKAGFDYKGGVWGLEKAHGAMPVYGYRPVLNAEEIHEWAKSQGFTQLLHPDEMHVTVLYSKRAFSQLITMDAQDGYKPLSHWSNTIVKDDKRSIMPLGDQGAVVLKIQHADLVREHEFYTELGASWDYPEYQPHVTLTYNGAPEDLSEVEPFTGSIVLGATCYELIEDKTPTDFNHVSLSKGFQFPKFLSFLKKRYSEPADESDPVFKMTQVLKADDEKRIVWGWASVTTKNNEPVIDHHNHIIPTEVMVDAADNFMLFKRNGKAMHQGDDTAIILHSFPYSHELGKALGFTCDQEGWVIAMKILDDDHWEKVKSGEYPAFSIGGKAVMEDA